MKPLITFIVAALILSGCAATPEFIADCPVMYEAKDDIELCESRVISNDDVRFKRTQMKLDKAKCLAPRVWEAQTSLHGRCVQQSIW